MCYLGFPANAPAPPEGLGAPLEQQEAPKERAPLPYGDEFMMHCYKVVECDNPEHTRDDWDMCPFAHVGEVVTRRPPQTHLPKLCPKARRACRKGRACVHAHNCFELWLHPSRFKTELCSHGARCDRPLCFFAHYDYEIRRPSPSADEVMAAAEAAGLLGRPSQASSTCCARSGAGSSCHTSSGSGSSRRSSDLGGPLHPPFGALHAQPAWLGQGAALAAAQAHAQQAQAQAQAQMYDRINADFAFAAQCLQAQQHMQAAAMQQQQQQQRQAAAAAGWSSGEWALLSSGASSPPDTSAASLLGFGTPSPPLPVAPAPRVGALGGGAPFDLWSLGGGPAARVVPAPPAPAAPPGLGRQGLTNDEALLLLAGLPGRSAAATNYLCALQSEQARLAAGSAPFF
ncbi:hypothetical protein Rsub_06463 [Raphidocelis subcapitata]|uniref:AtC3H23-like CCCH zinc finger domain-containing protein n=1 Tax=Raphidocelis subcapitata TaxID=307507 RepID=A0A2V0P8H9_9CHLO|nr:hypothetical protein Rsub_06463 [Raphidocelis subcapitata]|eukprot:GBF94193.1 hypothetical protein Rsub_06463 [Raphidocelis subcapitata]